MDRLNAMRVFVTVIDLGSQSAAADYLQLSRPVVSRYLAELEDWVGTRLMQRTTRKLSLTAAGQETLPRCRQLLELAGDLQAAVQQPEDAPRGGTAYQRQYLIRPGTAGGCSGRLCAALS